MKPFGHLKYRNISVLTLQNPVYVSIERIVKLRSIGLEFPEYYFVIPKLSRDCLKMKRLLILLKSIVKKCNAYVLGLNQNYFAHIFGCSFHTLKKKVSAKYKKGIANI